MVYSTLSDALTHSVPNIDIALASPVVALREGFAIWEHVTALQVRTLPKAIVIHP